MYFTTATQSLRLTDGQTNACTAWRLLPHSLKMQPTVWQMCKGGEIKCEGEGCRRETESRVRGRTFLSFVWPQLGSDRVRLEPKISSVSRSERCPCSPPSPAFPALPLCCLSSSRLSRLSNACQLNETWAHARSNGRTRRAQTKQLVSVYPWRPSSYVSLPSNQALPEEKCPLRNSIQACD